MEKNNDADFEIKFYEGILEKKEDFLQALIALGNLYTEKGLYEKGLEVDEKLVRLQPEDPLILYNLACSYSLLNKVSKSFDSMKKAISCGYSDFDYMNKDDDLSNLLKTPRFKKYMSKLKAQEEKTKSK